MILKIHKLAIPLHSLVRVTRREGDLFPPFPLLNFKSFSPLFSSSFHLSITVLVRYRSLHLIFRIRRGVSPGTIREDWPCYSSKNIKLLYSLIEEKRIEIIIETWGYHPLWLKKTLPSLFIQL